MALSFAEKRLYQQTIVQQNAILANNPPFAEKRKAQAAKLTALNALNDKDSTVLPDAGTNSEGDGTLLANDDGSFGLQASGIKTREKLNAKAQEIIDRVTDASQLTADDIAILKQYSGKGGLTENSQYEYYTPTHVAAGMWDMLKVNGFENGNILEPSTGAGVFGATKPQGSVISGAEIDKLSSTINQLLHPEDTIFNESFEKLATRTPDNHFDAVIGNVPFGDARGSFKKDDPQYRSENVIDRYFVSRVIDKTRPGGLITLIVPTRVIGNTQTAWKKFRAEISRKAEFLGGHKLPSKTFGKQGTSVVTDIIVLRKHSADLLEKIDGYTSEQLKDANVLWSQFIDGKYWQGEGLKFIKGQYVPPNKDDFRPMEKVIADESMTDESLKRALAIKFDSRIKWDVLDAIEPVINYYAEGDRRVINGKDSVLENGVWHPVTYGENNSGTLDKSRYGHGSIEALTLALESNDTMLSMTYLQASNALDDYPNLFNADQRSAVVFARSQPLDSFKEQAYRGTLIGNIVARFNAAANYSGVDETEQARVRRLLENEVATYGHPKNIKGFVLEGEQARHFGAFLGAIDENGNLSSRFTTGVVEANGYTADDPISIVHYFHVEGLSNVSLDDFNRLYKGGRDVKALGDVADIDGLIITPDGFISTNTAYLNGEIYKKSAELQNAIEAENDPRVKSKYQKQIDMLLAIGKHTNIEDISFGLRDNWYDNRYKLEFLANSGYSFEYSQIEMGDKVSETGEVYTGAIRTQDTSVAGGTWSINMSQRKRSKFAAQLEYYMNGQSIAYRMQKDDPAKIKAVDDLRRQVNDLEEQFKYFMQSHPDFQEIEHRYNTTFNNYVKPDYDKGDLGLKGLPQGVELHWYQNQGVRQLSENGSGILGFDVGLGKTFSALALSKFDRQMGRSSKHCAVVPNSVLANWYMESKTLYGNHDDIMFVGFEPEYDLKTGEIKREVVLDENGNPAINEKTKEVIYQDVLRKDTPEEVYAKMHSIPYTKKSLVIMTQEKFKTIPLREETRSGYTDKWVEKSMMSAAQAKKLLSGDETDDAEKRSYNDAKKGDRLAGQFSDEGGVKNDAIPFFEDMGFDRVIVDEGHQFRNSYQIQDGDTAKLAYLPNARISQRATDMAMKMAYLRDKYDGKGPILLTATPVANSPIEIFNMLSLVIDQSEFERLGIFTPDDFVRQFGRIENVDKLNIRGIVERREGLAGFKNLNALRGLFHRYALMRDAKDVDPNGDRMKLPKAVEMIDQMDMDDEQSRLYRKLREEAKDAANPKKVASGEARPVFAVLRDMDRVTTDVDMYNKVITYLFKSTDESKIKALIDDLPATVKMKVTDEETGKKVFIDFAKKIDYSISGDTLTYEAPEGYESFINNRLAKFKIDYASHPLRPKYAKLIENMRSELDANGKQLVFTEEKSQHNKLLRLISNHLPVSPGQVEIINADTAAGEKLQQLSDAYNRGDVRIIIANKKAEVGVNLQKGTSAIHHMTLPWNPASLQQRNGRGVRQGNKTSHVRVYYYQAKGSFDEYRLDLLKNKGNWIAALMDRNADNDSADNAEAMGAIEQAALLSDNREEFLRNIEAQRAKKAAEDKARRDNTTKIKLGQLTLGSNFLKTFEAKKSEALAVAARDVSKAESKLQGLKDSNAPKDDIDNAVRLLALAKNRESKVIPMWDKKKAENETLVRQLTSFLKGVSLKGELPFDVSILDDPANVLILKNRNVIAAGKTYKFTKYGSAVIAKVLTSDFITRKVTLETIIGSTISGQRDVEELSDAVEVTMAPDELERMKWLNQTHSYADCATMGKEFILNNVESLRISGERLHDYNGVLLWAYGTPAGTFVYPDKSDTVLLDRLTEAYRLTKLKLPGGFDQYGIGRLMPIFFGDDWDAVLSSRFKQVSKEDATDMSVKAIREAFGTPPLDTQEDVEAAMRLLRSGAYSAGEVYLKAKQVINDWVQESGFINAEIVITAFREVLDGKNAELMERLRQIEADKRRLADEALRNVPGYKEIPANVADGFRNKSIQIFFNTETVKIHNKYERVVIEPYGAVWMKDSGYTLKGKLSGRENPLKNKYSAKFCSEVAQGDSKYGNNTWRVPADSDLTELFNDLF